MSLKDLQNNSVDLVLPVFLLTVFMVLLSSSGYSAVGTNCLNNQTILDNTSFDGTLHNSSYVCDYGCDQTLNRCRTVDVGYGAIVLGVLIFFVCVMFFLSWYFKPKSGEEGEIDLGAIGLSFFWLFIGLLGILGMLFFVSGVGANMISAFIGSSVEWIKTFTTIYSYLLGVFFVFFFVLYIKALLDNFNVERGEK